MKKTALFSLCLSLVACASLEPAGGVRNSNLLLADSNGGVERYADVIGTLPTARWYDADLPLEPTRTSGLPQALAWLGNYDVDLDAVLDRNELCRAWFTKLAEIKSSRPYAAAALRSYGAQASASPAVAATAAADPCLDVNTRRAARAALTAAIAARRAHPTTLAEVEAMFDRIAPAEEVLGGAAFGDGGAGGSGSGGDGGGDGAGGGGGGR
ncbi:MAG: hypothetical protein IPM60_02215 [Rhodospirillales bacterium]|nr:hypothetical protein [Rhodospirillales bacterium]